MTAEALRDAEPDVPVATIRAAQAGDQDAFEELMIRTERRVAHLAWRILGDAEEVKEALQETFLRLYRHLGSYDEGRSFVGWLYRIAVNVCRDLDRRRRRRRIFSPISDALPMAGSDDTGRRAELSALARAIDALPEKERLAVILRDVEELPASEVAEILGSSASTVRVQVRNARAKLRRWLS